MQTRIDSLMEAVCNTAIGYVISFLTWILIVVPLFHLPVSMSENFWITNIFTVVSVLRSYILRRIFNGRSIWGSLREACSM